MEHVYSMKQKPFTSRTPPLVTNNSQPHTSHQPPLSSETSPLQLHNPIVIWNTHPCPVSARNPKRQLTIGNDANSKLESRIDKLEEKIDYLVQDAKRRKLKITVCISGFY